MNHVLHWRDARAYYGRGIDTHTQHLRQASQATYGLLLSRSLDGGALREASGQGLHAEGHLLRSDLWQKELPAALDRWDERNDPMLVLLALNRSPCSDCAHQLAGALNALHDRFPLRAERQHFVLASLGYYQGAKFMSSSTLPRSKAPPQDVSTHRGMVALREAGWRLAVLDFGQGLTRRGEELLEYLQHLD